jgi:DNA repair protein RecN (Recombination protein N)
VEVREALEGLYQEIYEGEGSAGERLDRASRALRGLARVSVRLDALSTRLEGLRVEVSEVAREVRDLKETVEADPGRVEALEERRHAVRELLREMGPSEEDFARRRGELEAGIAALRAEGGGLEEARRGRAPAARELVEAGEGLSSRRAEGRKGFVSGVLREMADLGMAKTRLDAALESRAPAEAPLGDRAGEDGFDRFDLLVSFNPGAAPAPLREVASGGELARLLLALRSRWAARGDVGCLVFDEVDAHVGGRLGRVLGEKLRGLSAARQVITVTHLPSVACCADHHLKVEKREGGGRTAVDVRPLGPEERVVEIAEMIRGADRTDVTLEEAREMLGRAGPGRREAGGRTPARRGTVAGG